MCNKQDIVHQQRAAYVGRFASQDGKRVAINVRRRQPNERA
jgi:hypothetical protein